jgi:hypothetical protein
MKVFINPNYDEDEWFLCGESLAGEENFRKLELLDTHKDLNEHVKNKMMEFRKETHIPRCFHAGSQALIDRLADIMLTPYTTITDKSETITLNNLI